MLFPSSVKKIEKEKTITCITVEMNILKVPEL